MPDKRTEDRQEKHDVDVNGADAVKKPGIAASGEGKNDAWKSAGEKEHRTSHDAETSSDSDVG